MKGVPVSRPKRHDLEDGNKPDLFETSYQLYLTLTTGEPNHQSSEDRIECMLGKCSFSYSSDFPGGCQDALTTEWSYLLAALH